MWKICTKCGKHKALWDFPKNKHSTFSLRGDCRECNKKRCKKYYQNNQEYYKKNQREYRCKNREIIIEKARIYRKENLEAVKSADRKRYWKNREKRLAWNRQYRKDNIEIYRENDKKRGKRLARFKTYSDRLTIDEGAMLSKDGISLEVKCKYCRKYFKPTNSQVWHRMVALDGRAGNAENNLYCSEECKVVCPVFKTYALVPNNPTLREPIPQELRDEILSRNDGMCEMCGEHPSEEVHHEKPVATHPHLQLDKDNLWGLCKYCHYEVCHQLEGCTLAELRKNSVNTVCNRT
jgi:hypothetical protein